MTDDINGGQQALEPVLQEEVPFKDHTITAVKLADGRYAVVLRWVCEVLHLDPSGQVQRIQRTPAIAGELLRVKVQPRPGAEKPRRGGGAQIMPILTLRGFSPWILGINPNEVEENPEQPEQAERIREMIIAYQQEAIDVLYTHFLQRTGQRPATLPAPRSALVVPAEPLLKPTEPGPDATDAEQAAYYENLMVWAAWKAAQHNRLWRTDVEKRIDGIEVAQEGDHAMLQLIPEIIERLGAEPVTTSQQASIREMVKRLCEASGAEYQTVYWELTQAFNVPRYIEILKDDYPAVCQWFESQMQTARSKKKRP